MVMDGELMKMEDLAITRMRMALMLATDAVNALPQHLLRSLPLVANQEMKQQKNRNGFGSMALDIHVNSTELMDGVNTLDMVNCE